MKAVRCLSSVVGNGGGGMCGGTDGGVRGKQAAVLRGAPYLLVLGRRGISATVRCWARVCRQSGERIKVEMRQESA